MPEPRTPGAAPIVAFEGVEKSFFGVKVLKEVSCTVEAGRVVGLVGENGAGKSTLMNILGGNLQPDAGTLRVNGRPYAPSDPHDALDAGIAFVHQELNLFPNLSIAENLHIASFPLAGEGLANGRDRAGFRLPWISRALLRARTTKLLREVGLDRDPDTPVERLPSGERQLVEVAKALDADARVLILDEPTTSLSARECDRLFALMNQLRDRGIAMIYISHAIGDVLRLCDDLVVLRDGQVVGGGSIREFTHDRVVSLMVGRQLDQLYPSRARWLAGTHPASESSGGKAAAPGEALLEVRSLSQPGMIRDVSLRLDSGEVVGIFGLMGAGRSELARILFGLDPCESGDVLLAGEPLVGAPRARIDRGLAFLTEDRRQEGLCVEAPIADNLALVTLPEMSRTPARLLDFQAIRSAVERMRESVRLGFKGADAQPVRTLSGGNQQKVVLGKWLLAKPKVLILDEPTRGIDVGAKFEIYQLIHQLADGGAGVLVISSELEELIGICDRLLVMRHGEITAEFHREELDRERILRAALHTPKQEQAGGASAAVAPPRSSPASKPLLRLLDFSPAALFGLVLLVFGLQSDRFLTVANLTQVLIQASSTIVAGVGMTFVLLTAGVDLSIGALMFVGAGLAGLMALDGQPVALCLLVMLATGMLGGAINALLVTRLGLVAFIATLATLYIGRGAGRWITQTRAMNLPDSFLALGSTKWLGVPLPIWIVGFVVLAAQVVLSRTPFGRQLYAVGNSVEAAKKAGLRTGRLLASVFVICGTCAGLSGILALSQLGAVSPKFGEFYEFDAITAAVLGGTSLFGGRGNVFPGTVLGAVLLKTIFSGLVIAQADPYLYPLITSAIIFLAVLIDSGRNHLVARLNRRRIYTGP